MPNSVGYITPGFDTTDNTFVIAGTSNANTSIAAALNHAPGSAYGYAQGSSANSYLHYAFAGGSVADGGFAMPAFSQVRAIQLICNAEYVPPGSVTMSSIIGSDPGVHTVSFVPSDGSTVFFGLSSTAAIYASSSGPWPSGGQLQTANSPIFDISSYGITAAFWNQTSYGYGQPGVPVLHVQTNLSAGAPTVNVYGLVQLAVYYNQQPVSVVNIGGSTGTFNIATLTPRVSWTYSDPEGDIQESFRVRVYDNTPTSVQTNVLYETRQYSAATNWTIPAGVLNNYNNYYIEVLVSDLGSGGRLTSQTITSTYVHVTTQVDPVLMPGFTPQFSPTNPQPAMVYNASSGVISNLNVASRINLFTQADASFSSGGTNSHGSWTISGATFGTNTWTATGATTIMTSPSVPVSYLSSGSVICGMICLKTNATSRRTATITFTGDMSTTPVTGYLNNTGFTKLFIWAPLPYTATASPNIQLQVSVAGQANGEIVTFKYASLTPNLLNVLENSSFELSPVLGTANSAGIFWSSNVSNFGSGYTVAGGSTLDQDAAIPFAAKALQITAPANTDTAGFSSAVQDGTSVLQYALHGRQMIASAAVNGWGTSSFRMGFTGGTQLPTVIDTVPANTGWTRESRFIDATSLPATSFEGFLIGVTPGTAGSGIVDNVSLEPVWAPTNLDFEVSGGATNPSLGTDPSGWFNECVQYPTAPGISAAIVSTAPYIGTKCMGVSSNGGTIPAVTSQYVTIGGWGSITLGWAYKIYTAGVGASSSIIIRFYDPAGNPLYYTDPMLGVVPYYQKTYTGVGGWINEPLFSITPPTGVSYMKVSLTQLGAGTTYYDALTIQPGVAVTLTETQSTFETGVDTSYWTGTGTTGVPVQSTPSTSYQGTKAMRVTSSGATISLGHTYLTGLSAGQTVYLSSYILSNSLSTIFSQVKFYDNSSTLLSTVNGTGIQTSTTVWQQYAVNAVAPANTVKAVVNVFATSASLTNQIYDVDRVTISVGQVGVQGPSPWLDGGWSQGMSTSATTPTYPVSMSLQRSYDSGATWNTLVRAPGRTIAAQLPVSGLQFDYTLSDYEYIPLLNGSPPASLWYRAVTQVAQSPSAGSTSLASPIRVIPLQPFNDWWLFDPNIPANNRKLQVKTFKASTTEEMTTFSGMGRTRRTVIGDTVQGDLIDLDLLSLAPLEMAALLTQINKQTVLVLRAPFGEQWFVRSIKRDRVRTWTGSYLANTLTTHSVQFQEVDPLL